MFIKEQRVDGNYINLYIRDSMLRCTLKRFERISYSNFRLNQILNKQLPSTAVRNTDSKNLLEPKSSDKNTNIFSLNPWFITGFADAESCFSILIQPNNKYKTNYRVKAIFTIGLHKKDFSILEDIKNTLGVGTVTFKGTSPCLPC